MHRLRQSLWLSLVFLLLLSACQPSSEESITANESENTGESIEVVYKSAEEQQQILDSYTYDDYKQIFDQVVREAKKLETENEALNKWVMRVLVEEQLYLETDLTTEQVLEMARQKRDNDRAWKTVASENYGIEVDEQEIDDFITSLPDTGDLPQHQAFADALGLTLQELNHRFDRDLYEKQVIWSKLLPELQKKYDTDINNSPIEAYQKEVQSYLNENES